MYFFFVGKAYIPVEQLFAKKKTKRVRTNNICHFFQIKGSLNKLHSFKIITNIPDTQEYYHLNKYPIFFRFKILLELKILTFVRFSLKHL